MIDTEREDLYRWDKPREITKNRLMQLNLLGMEEVGVAQFGIRGVISGIYIERVWNYSDEQWDDYLKWMQEVISRPR